MHIAYLSLGSNLGDRYGNLMQALEKLATWEGVALHQVSSIYETEPWGNEQQDRFLNLCCEIHTLLLPNELLEVCHHIEQQLQRIRTEHWGPRTIDLDILLYDDRVEKNDKLQIPHQFMLERLFVIQPLADIASSVKHPITKQTIGQVLSTMNRQGIHLYEE